MYKERKNALLVLILSAAIACIMAGCGQKTVSTTEAASGNTAEEVQAEAAAAYEKADE